MPLPACRYCCVPLIFAACILSICSSCQPIRRRHSLGVSLRIRMFSVMTAYTTAFGFTAGIGYVDKIALFRFFVALLCRYLDLYGFFHHKHSRTARRTGTLSRKRRRYIIDFHFVVGNKHFGYVAFLFDEFLVSSGNVFFRAFALLQHEIIFLYRGQCIAKSFAVDFEPLLQRCARRAIRRIVWVASTHRHDDGIIRLVFDYR